MDRIDNPQLERCKFDPGGEYVCCWLPNLARLPTKWIRFVLQSIGVELGSNYPLPIVDILTAKKHLQDALSKMRHRKAVARASLENGTKEGMGESLENVNASLSEHMDVDRELVRNNTSFATRSQDDQLVPSISNIVQRIE